MSRTTRWGPVTSARLLRTTRPALLDSLYPDLVDGKVPQGADIFEITRFCLSRGVGARQRRQSRDLLLVGLVEYAMRQGFGSYTGVAECGWFEQIATFGWDCRALGAPVRRDGRLLTALRIDIDGSTLGKLEAAGIAADTGIAAPPAQAA